MTFFAWSIVRTQFLADRFITLRDQELQVEHLELRLAEKTAECARWEKRASTLIDQIGLGSGILSAPAMTPPASESEQPPIRQVMAALGRNELKSKKHSEAVPNPAPSLIGVNERDVADALRAIRDS